MCSHTHIAPHHTPSTRAHSVRVLTALCVGLLALHFACIESGCTVTQFYGKMSTDERKVDAVAAAMAKAAVVSLAEQTPLEQAKFKETVRILDALQMIANPKAIVFVQVRAWNLQPHVVLLLTMIVLGSSDATTSCVWARFSTLTAPTAPLER